MKIFLLWCFCLPTVMFVSGRILNDTSSPQRRAISYNLSPNIIFLHPPPKVGQKIGRILYLKQLLKLKCFRKIFNDIRNENRLRYLNPNRTNKPVKVSPFKNQQNRVLFYPKIRPNIITIEPQRKLYFGSNPIVFPPRKEKFTPKLTNRLQQKKTSNATEFKSNEKLGSSSEKKQNIIYSQVVDKYKNSDTQKTVTSVSYPKTEYKLIPPVDHLQQQMNPTNTYEVTEAVEEKIIIDFVDQKNDSKNRQFDVKPGLSYLRKAPGKNEVKTKTDIDKEVNAILRTSGNSTTKKNKEIFYNSSDHNGYLASNSDNRPLIINKKIVGVKPTVSPQGKSKQLKITHPYYYETNENTKEILTKTTARIENNIETTVRVEKMKSHTTKVTNTPLEIFRTREWPERQTTTVPEIQTSSDLDLPDVLINDVTSDISTLFPFTDTETTVKKLTTSENEDRSDFFVTLPEIEITSAEEATKELINENVLPSNPSEKDRKYSEVTQSMRKMTIGKSDPETELTLPIFTEFTDLPLTIDLLTAFKKDQENSWKNSRKMNFNKEILTTTISNQVSESGDLEQRRSDILIDEAIDDYLHDDNDSLNYLEQLKQTNFHNLTSDSIIQLIPFVINDLRDDRIAPEDIPILSKAFGKYWNIVLALSNNTDLDMLPLLKMKNEEDLNNIIRTFFPENLHLLATDSKEIYRDNYMEYYYQDEYEDLREDNLKIAADTEKTFRFKRDEVNSRYFEAAEQKLIKYESGLNIDEDWRKNKSILLENEND